MNDDLEAAVRDTLDAGGDVLDRHPSPHPVRVAGVEFARHPRVAVLVSDDPLRPPQALDRWPATRADADFVHAAEVLAVAWMSALSEQTRIVVAGAMDLSAASLRIYARPSVGAVALVLKHQGRIIEIARRTIEPVAAIH